jgi:hypothetical protein
MYRYLAPSGSLAIIIRCHLWASEHVRPVKSTSDIEPVSNRPQRTLPRVRSPYSAVRQYGDTFQIDSLDHRLSKATPSSNITEQEWGKYNRAHRSTPQISCSFAVLKFFARSFRHRGRGRIGASIVVSIAQVSQQYLTVLNE